MSRKRISEIIKVDEIRQWKEGEVIIVAAGTGAGKSYFIKNILYAFAKKNNEKILMLIHRKNCTDQFYKEIMRDMKADVIDIKTYQSIEHREFNLSEYKYIVSDEFHYFMSDASFNKTTDISLNKILNEDSIRIFMSATGEYVQKYIGEHKNIPTKQYDLPISYDFINSLTFFYKDEVIDEYIRDIIKDGTKAILFIKSAEKAYSLYSKYKENCLFNCSKSNSQYYKYVDEDKINYMLSNERFEENILITTLCMDAGVNIIDSELTNILCDVDDIGTLIQCIGRKRIVNDDDKIQLIIKNISNQQLGGKKSALMKKIEKADFLRMHTVKQYIRKYPRDTDYSNIVYDEIVEEDEYATKRINELMYFKCKEDIDLIDNMLSLSSRGFSDYLNYKVFKFEDPYSDKDLESAKNLLEEFLESMTGKIMYNVMDRKELIEKINVRSNGKLLKSMNTLNEALERRKLPYIIKVVEGSFTIEKDGKKKRCNNAWEVIRFSREK